MQFLHYIQYYNKLRTHFILFLFKIQIYSKSNVLTSHYFNLKSLVFFVISNLYTYTYSHTHTELKSKLVKSNISHIQAFFYLWQVVHTNRNYLLLLIWKICSGDGSLLPFIFFHLLFIIIKIIVILNFPLSINQSNVTTIWGPFG